MLLHGFYGNPYNIPLGGMLDFTGTTAPNSSFVLPFGQAISRTTYAAYFAWWGRPTGPATARPRSTSRHARAASRPARTTWAVGGEPDDRGPFGTIATTLGAAGGSESHTLTTAQMPSHTHTGATSSDGAHSPHRDRCVPDWRQPG